MSWKLLSREYLFRRPPWLTVRHDRLELPNGNIIPEYYVLEYPDWVNVIPITEEGKFVMVTQYRHGIGRVLTEIPAGALEKNDSSPLAGARRELLEETGYGGGEWIELMRISGNAATTSNITHCFLARGVHPVGEPHFDSGEDLTCSLYTEAEVKSMLLEGKIVQSLIAAPLWKYFALKGTEF
ncbi:MAG: NUDIX hydrolase [Lentisphaeria bacterium]|nr:NUDIX hydrolase [Lentisphaeria bacterium]